MSCELCGFIDELEIINDIKFTIKEIDVISALINGKSIKSIAVLLNLSPKTVETHLRNIKQKLNCSSKETVIDFIENSNKYLLFNKHYTNLLINAEFEKLLKKIGKIGQEIGVKCSKVCNRVIQHLNMCNIQINDKASVIFDCKAKDYYLGFLDLIQELRQDVITDKQIEEFKKFYEEKTTNVVIVKDIKNSNIFTRKNKRYLTYIATIVLGVISLFICINYENPIQVRMDIPKIHEEVLLKRSQITRQIDRILDKQEGIKIVVLTGPGGAGKTTIAREYIIAQSSNVIWEINAETENSIVNSLGDLANGLAKTKEQKEKLAFINSIKEYKEKNKRLLEFISGLLNKAKKWYLLFDNVDDFNMVKKYIPYNEKAWGKGRVIITTRNENIKNVNYLHKDYVVAITDLSIEESSRLCCDIMNVENKKSIQEFVKKLPPHPLDISAAAYYMKNTGTSFEDYLRETNNKDFSKTQGNIQRDSIGYEKTREVILKSNFDSICKQNSEFKELLLFVSLLDSQNIPISYLKQLKDPITVDNFIYNLRKHSLIIPNKDNTFSIHRSTQSFGIRYVNSSVTQSEITQYLDRIVNVMTPYDELCWLLHSSFKRKIGEIEAQKLNSHFNSISKNISKLNIPDTKIQEYSTKILLSLAYSINSYIDEDKLMNLFKYIISMEKFIPRYEIAIIFSELTFYYLYKNTKLALLYANKAIDIAQKLNNGNNLVVLNKAYISLLESSKGDIAKSKKYIIEAWNDIIFYKNNFWVKHTAPLVWYMLIEVYINNYNNKDNLKDFVLDSIENLLCITKLNNFFKDPLSKRVQLFTLPITTKLVSLYNQMGLYKQALKKEKEAFFILNNSKLTYFTENKYKNRINIRYSKTLLRLNKIKQAYENCIICIDFIHNNNIDIDNIPELVVVRTEAMIRLGMLKKALNLKFLKANESNYSKLLFNIFNYHMSIIKYKQKEYDISLKYFLEFFKYMKEFCKGFLDESIYNNLEKEKAFEIIKEPKDIQKCLDNSLKIFTVIYGKDHSFVKDYVAENCKNRSWLYEHIKITGYYLQYYWDCFMKFLGFDPLVL